jgi:putative thiamine transport system ATP-binding protein
VRRFVFDHARWAALPTLLVTHDPADAEVAGGAVVEFPSFGAKLLPLRNSGRRPA